MQVRRHPLALPITWPPGLGFRARDWATGLRWGMSLADVTALAAGSVRAVDDGVVARLRVDDAASVQGIPLTATLVLELDRLVRIEFVGRLDALALAALGASEATLDDVDHHHIVVGRTRVAIDLLDGLIALEPDEAL